jgi:hypothetical protein
LPVEFTHERGDDRVLFGSDGLFKYAPLARIFQLASQLPAAEAVEALVSCVRLASGGLQDDVAVVIVAG